MPDEKTSNVSMIEPLDQDNSKRMFNLIKFLDNNRIDGMGKRFDGIYCFSYKQNEFNANNDFNRNRDIVYVKEHKDKSSKFFYKSIILDQYKNLLLRAPITYNEPKLPMDEKSIMKRRDDSLKKRKEEKK
jgi:hypothetical protein